MKSKEITNIDSEEDKDDLVKIKPRKTKSDSKLIITGDDILIEYVKRVMNLVKNYSNVIPL